MLAGQGCSAVSAQLLLASIVTTVVRRCATVGQVPTDCCDLKHDAAGYPLHNDRVPLIDLLEEVSSCFSADMFCFFLISNAFMGEQKHYSIH